MSNKTVYVQAGGGYERVVIGQSSKAGPGPGQIQVRLRANSLNYHDYLVIIGGIAHQEDRIPMADGAGEVVAVGQGVKEFAVGDAVVSTFFPSWLGGRPEVYGFGSVPGDGVDGYAREWVTAAATAFTHAPQGWSHAEASTLTTAALTAWRSLVYEARLKAGDTVLIQGTGGVSIFALQFAKMMGARVVATSSSNAKLERLQSLGADHVINYREDENWGKTALKLTGGRGADAIIEVGGSGTLAQSIRAARVGGCIAIIGILSGAAGKLALLPAVAKQVRLQTILVGSREQQQDMVAAIDANGMKPIIDRHFALDEIVNAFKYQESGQHFGKIVLDI